MGVILLCTGALIAVLLVMAGGALSALLYASPFLLCGVICLLCCRHAGLWCGWAVFVCVDAYLRYAAGLTWQIIFLTLRFTAEMNSARLAIGWVQFLSALALLYLTLRAFRTVTLPWTRRHLAAAAAGWVALAAVYAGEQAILQHWHSLQQIPSNSAYYFLRFGCDRLALAGLTALLVVSGALLRGRRQQKNA